MGYVNYRKYIRSSKWRRLRKERLLSANGLCEQCHNAAATDIHHRSYLHLGDERPEELLAVCPDCHEQLELAAGGYYRRRPKQNPKIKKSKPKSSSGPKLQLAYAKPQTRRKWWRILTKGFLKGKNPYPGTLAEFDRYWESKRKPLDNGKLTHDI